MDTRNVDSIKRTLRDSSDEGPRVQLLEPAKAAGQGHRGLRLVFRWRPFFKRSCKKGLKRGKSENQGTRQEASAARGMSYQTLTDRRDSGLRLGTWEKQRRASWTKGAGLENRDDVRALIAKD